MTLALQQTLAHPIETVGVGLHSGDRVRLRLRPAPVDHGIVFRRTDLPGRPTVAARADRVTETTLCTGLLEHGVRVRTVEHLLSALAGEGIDNVLVELDAEEVPIFDGSSGPIVHLIRSAGVKGQDRLKRFLTMKAPVRVTDGDRWAELGPASSFQAEVSIDFHHPAFFDAPQAMVWDSADGSYLQTIARARTFGFLSDVEALHDRGLARGGSLDNAVVFDELGVINPEGLRAVDEPLRHKVLDAIGDLRLLAPNLMARWRAHKPGHALNNALARAVLAQPWAWAWTDADGHPLTSQPPSRHAPIQASERSSRWWRPRRAGEAVVPSSVAKP